MKQLCRAPNLKNFNTQFYKRENSGYVYFFRNSRYVYFFNPRYVYFVNSSYVYFLVLFQICVLFFFPSLFPKMAVNFLDYPSYLVFPCYNLTFSCVNRIHSSLLHAIYYSVVVILLL